VQYSGADTRRACELHTHNLWSHADRDAYSDGAFANTDSNGNAYAIADSNGHCDRTAAAFTDAAASADTGAAPLGFFGITGTREATREFPA
jgi:hypothetical protein